MSGEALSVADYWYYFLLLARNSKIFCLALLALLMLLIMLFVSVIVCRWTIERHSPGFQVHDVTSFQIETCTCCSPIGWLLSRRFSFNVSECFLLCLLPFRCVVRRDKVTKMLCSHYFQISNLKHSRLAYITLNYYHHQPVINALHYNYIMTAVMSLVGDRNWVSLYYYGSSRRMCDLSLTERCTSSCECFIMLW